jgi:O-acetyl-ADP-ribose deacetylase (regulator of RNase III)
MITIKQGDIFLENGADFILNPSNTDLFLGSGVSRAFKINCDKDLQNEMKKLAPIKQGEIVITKCSDKFKHAIHAAVMDYSKPNPNPTYETVRIIIQNLKKLLQQHPNSKTVLPLIGTGVGGLDKKRVIQIYKDELTDIGSDIVIYGYTNHDYELIKQIFNN